MRQGITSCREQGISLFMPFLSVLHAEVEAESEGIESALAILIDAEKEIEQTRQNWIDAELYRQRGELSLRRTPADIVGAESAFSCAVEAARGQQTKTFELRAALSLAKLYHATSRVDAASAVLAPALDGFSPTQELPEIEEAQILLAALNA
jgi:predicted ATPase